MNKVILVYPRVIREIQGQKLIYGGRHYICSDKTTEEFGLPVVAMSPVIDDDYETAAELLHGEEAKYGMPWYPVLRNENKATQ